MNHSLINMLNHDLYVRDLDRTYFFCVSVYSDIGLVDLINKVSGEYVATYEGEDEAAEAIINLKR